jgi:hypothetical protein
MNNSATEADKELELNSDFAGHTDRRLSPNINRCATLACLYCCHLYHQQNPFDINAAVLPPRATWGSWSQDLVLFQVL